MSIIFRNGKYYDSNKEEIPKETQTIEPKEKLSFIDKFGSNFKLSEYLKPDFTEKDTYKKIKKILSEEPAYTYTTTTTHTNFKDAYYAHIQGIIPTPSQIMEIPKGGIWNDLIEYEYKKFPNHY